MRRSSGSPGHSRPRTRAEPRAHPRPRLGAAPARGESPEYALRTGLSSTFRRLGGHATAPVRACRARVSDDGRMPQPTPPALRARLAEIFAARDRANMQPTIDAFLAVLAEHPDEPEVLYEV